MNWIKQITESNLVDFPTGAFDLFFAARYHQLRGDTSRAIGLFEKAISAQSELPQIHSVARWDLLWCFA